VLDEEIGGGHSALAPKEIEMHTSRITSESRRRSPLTARRLVMSTTIAITLSGLPARADVYDACHYIPFAGDCVVGNPVVVNVYWDTRANVDTTEAQWNADVAASPTSASGTTCSSNCLGTSDTADFTVDRIDTLTKSLVNSQYFSLLRQYNVYSVSYLPHIMVPAKCGVPPTSINTAVSQFGNLADCVVKANPQITDPRSTIMNILLPPWVGAASPSTDFCATQSNGWRTLAKHDQFGNVQAPLTVISTNASCVPTGVGDEYTPIQMLFSSITHEMVEAMTHPNPLSPGGWWNFNGEIGDFCEQNDITFLYSHAQRFYSNDAQGCAPQGSCGVVDSNPCAASQGTLGICGSGQNMNLEIQVPVGPQPTWDWIANANVQAFQPQGADTSYLNAKIGTGSTAWMAGGVHDYPQDQVLFGQVFWNGQAANPYDSYILIKGFDLGYGGAKAVLPGDLITINVFNSLWGEPWATGTSTYVPIQSSAPFPAEMDNFLAAVPTGFLPCSNGHCFIAGDTGFIQANMNDSRTCGLSGHSIPNSGIQGAALTITSSDSTTDTLTPGTASTYNDGSFYLTYVPSLGGDKTITVTTTGARQTTLTFTGTAAITPYLRLVYAKNAPTVLPAYGSVKGGQALILKGAGFQGGAGHTLTVTFQPDDGSPVATLKYTDLTSVTSGEIDLSTPPSPCANGGACRTLVTVTIDNETSDGLDYYYDVLGTPNLTFSAPNCGAGSLPTLTACSRDQDGNLATDPSQQGDPLATATITTVAPNYLIDPTTGNQVQKVSVANCNPVFYSDTNGLFTATILTVKSSANGIVYTNFPCTPPYFPTFSLINWWRGPPVDRPFMSNILNGSAVIWTPGGDPYQAQNTVAIAGNPALIQPVVNVHELSNSGLAAQLDLTPQAVVNARATGTIHTVGSTLVVTAGNSLNLPYQATLSFAVRGAPPAGSSYKILGLTATTPGNLWQEVPLTSAAGPVTATVTKTGVYALVLYAN
jgi:hypothetical protein